MKWVAQISHTGLLSPDGVVNVQAPPLNIIEGAAGELCLSSTMDERASITVDISVNDTNATGEVFICSVDEEER